MLVTLKEAKKMVCPILSAGAEIRYCWGNECMFWRWTEEATEDGMLGYCKIVGPSNQRPDGSKVSIGGAGNE